MLSINWSDVWKMVESVKVPLIVIGVALALAIIVSLAVFTLDKPQRKLARSTSWVAAFVAVVVAVVSMMYGGFKICLLYTSCGQRGRRGCHACWQRPG